MSCILLQCLTRAAVDLRLTHHPVARIAGEWGYSSHQTFAGGGGTRRHFGVSPDCYRQLSCWMQEKLTTFLCVTGSCT